jgi:hypothetical protein
MRKMINDYSFNFRPAVKCPHCGKVNHPCISGFGGELSSRYKACKFCEKEYTVLVLTVPTLDDNITPTRLSQMHRRINLLKERIKRKIGEAFNHAADLADEIIRIEASSSGRQN